MRRTIDYVKLEPLLRLRKTYTLEETEMLLHGVDVVERFRREKKLVPCVVERKRVLFPKTQVQACQDDLLNGVMPMPLPKKAKTGASAVATL